MGVAYATKPRILYQLVAIVKIPFIYYYIANANNSEHISHIYVCEHIYALHIINAVPRFLRESVITRLKK